MTRTNLLLTNLRFYCPVLLCFSIPISTSVTTVCMALTLLLWLFQGSVEQKWRSYWSHPLTPYLLSLMALTCLSAWTSSGETEQVVERISDGFRLCLIPIFATMIFHPRQIVLGFYAFITAMSVTVAAGIAKIYFQAPIGEKYTSAAVFKSHIDTNFFMSMAAFYALFFAFKHKKYRGLLLTLAGFMLYYIFFMSIGRIGYITIFILCAYVATHLYGRKGFLTATLLVLLSGLVLYEISDLFQQRVSQLTLDWDYYKQGRLVESSLGSRLHFYLSSLELWLQKPVLGWGAGSYGVAYDQLNQGQYLFTDNPHNEFLRVGVEIGLVGFGILMMLFARQWMLYAHVPASWQVIARGSLLLFVTGCMLNSWLTDFAESYFYVVFTAMSLSSIKPLRPGDLVKAPLH